MTPFGYISKSIGIQDANGLIYAHGGTTLKVTAIFYSKWSKELKHIKKSQASLPLTMNGFKSWEAPINALKQDLNSYGLLATMVIPLLTAFHPSVDGQNQWWNNISQQMVESVK